MQGFDHSREHLKSLEELADEDSKGPPTRAAAWESVTLESLIKVEQNKLKGYAAEFKEVKKEHASQYS
jgi:hypothetical protein